MARAQDLRPMDAAEQSAPSSRRVLAWQIGGLALLVVFLFASSFSHLHDPRAQRSDDYAKLYLETMIESRVVYFAAHRPEARTMPSADSARKSALIADMNRLVDLEPNPRAIRRLALMQYALSDPRWKSSLLRLYDLPGTGASFDTEHELAMWHVVLDGHAGAQQAQIYRARIEGMGLGWYSHLALAAMCRNAGMTAAARAESESASDSTARVLQFLEAGVFIGRLGLFLGIGFLARLWKVRSTARAGRYPAARTAPSTLPALTRGQADALYSVFLVYLSLFALFHLALSEVLPIAAVRLAPGGRPLAALLCSLGVSIATFALAYAVFRRLCRRTDLTPADIGLRSRNLGKDVLWGLGGYAVAMPLLTIASLLSGWLFRSMRSPSHPALLEIAGIHGLLYQILVFGQVAILPPLIEETMFRGVFFRAVSPRMGTYAAVAVTSGIFAILHPQLPFGFLGIFVLGVLFNALYILRGSLVPSMVAHAINNGAIFLLFTLLTAD